MKTIKKIHGSAHSFFRRILPHSPDKIKHWKDMNEMHGVLDRFPGYFKALVLELMEKPMSCDEMWESVTQLEARLGKRHRGRVSKDNLHVDLEFSLEHGVLEEKDGKFFLTPGGRPAALKAAAYRSAQSGVCEECFRITALPATRAWVAWLRPRRNGKFQGVMTPTTPSDCARSPSKGTITLTRASSVRRRSAASRSSWSFTAYSPDSALPRPWYQ